MLVTPVSQRVKEKSGDKISSGLLRYTKNFGMEKVAGNIVLQMLNSIILLCAGECHMLWS